MVKKVLVIEDNAELAELMEIALTSAGYEVETTSSGLTGLLRFSEAPADVVLLDMQIHDLSGPGVHRAIRDLCPTAAVLCMSAQSSRWVADALDQGATACLHKPFALNELLALLDALTRGEARLPEAPGDVRKLGSHDLARLAALSTEDLDALPFGAIRVDAQGRITTFNSHEVLASRRFPDTMIGHHIADVAPCLMVKEFLSCLDEGVQRREVDRVLRFVFPRHGAQCVVAVRLYHDAAFAQTWLFISAARGQAMSIEGRDDD